MTDPDSPTVPDNAEPLNDSAPLAALRDLDEAGNELSLGEIALGQDGELVRRGLECPITFQFNWRETTFNGRVEQAGDKLCLRLLADLHVVPFTSEDIAKRDRLLALCAQVDCGRAGKLELLNNHMISFGNDIEMPRSSRNLDITIIEHITILVLLAAPHIERLDRLGA